MSDEKRSPQPETQDLSEILRIRRDKLTKLQQEGRDPFAVTRFDRTGFTADIRAAFEETGEEAQCRICGRLKSKRDMGKALSANLALCPDQ